MDIDNRKKIAILDMIGDTTSGTSSCLAFQSGVGDFRWGQKRGVWWVVEIKTAMVLYAS